jgi:hypothetical protein
MGNEDGTQRAQVIAHQPTAAQRVALGLGIAQGKAILETLLGNCAVKFARGHTDRGAAWPLAQECLGGRLHEKIK